MADQNSSTPLNIDPKPDPADPRCICVATVQPYDRRKWRDPKFARYRQHKNAFVVWPKGSGYDYNKDGDMSAGGTIVANTGMLLPGGVYAVGQKHRYDPSRSVSRRFLWAGRRFLPESAAAYAEATEYLVVHGLPAALKRNIEVAVLQHVQGPELTTHPVPLRWYGPTPKRNAEGRIAVAQVFPFDPAEWQGPWIAVPGQGGGYDFSVAMDEGGTGRVGAFVGSPQLGGNIMLGYVAAGQVYCIGQTNLSDSRRNIRLHLLYDGDQFFVCDRSGKVRPAG